MRFFSFLPLIGLVRANCPALDPGQCTLQLTGGHGPLGLRWWEALICDHTPKALIRHCPLFQGDRISSSLQYDVVITSLASGNGVYDLIGMSYAAYSYKGYFECGLYSGINTCTHTFPC